MPRISKASPGRLRWWLEGEPTPLLETLMADPDSVLEGPGSVARAPAGRKRFYRVEGGTGEPTLLVKVFRLSAGLPRLRYLLRPSKARHEARVARQMVARGFDVALPIAVGEERRGGLLRRSFSITVELPARDLSAVLRTPMPQPGARRALLESFAVFSRRIHDAGIDQDDFAPNNFLLTDEGGFVLIDFERCQVGRPLGARRWKLLAKLHRHDFGIPRTDRLRFLRAYLGPDADRVARRRAWEQIRAAFWRIRTRDARHAARGAFREGRRLAREGDVWVVRGREQAPVLRLSLRESAARDVWVRAQQLERLGLPALRPVRLGREWVDLERPDSEGSAEGRESLVRRAQGKFAPYGHFVGPAEWAFSAEGARLQDPRAFELDL